MKKLACVVLALIAFFGAFVPAQAQTYYKFSYAFFGTFDTLITVLGYAENELTFNRYAALAEEEMTRYHQIFDQYNEYTGVNNLSYINSHAGSEAVEADPVLVELLLDIQKWHSQYGKAADPSLGSVLSLWHEAREDGTYIPLETELMAAAEHVGFENVIIDEENNTIAYADPELRLDLGAVAKGYAAQRTAETLYEAGFTSFILNAGGNVVCADSPLDGRACWVVGIEDVDGSSIRHKIGLANMSIVTSGDYQRYYEVDGERYHHLIDPVTLFPAKYVRAVSVLHPDSGLADFLSTSAFVVPYEQSRALIESIPEAEGMWLFEDGTEYWTDGFQPYLDLVK